jgi:S1-C subfamily serine protease
MRSGERFRLLQVSSPDATVEFTRLPLTVGSGPDADVVVPEAAPRHCLLFQRDNDVFVLDSGSGRGTRVGGRSVQEAVLRHGDLIELGEGGPGLRFEREDRRRERRLADASIRRWLHGGGHRARRVAAAGAVVAVAALFALGWNWREARRLRGEVKTLRAAVQQADAGRHAFEARVEDERRRAGAERERLQQRLAEFRSREQELNDELASAAAGEVQGLRDELAATRGRIHALEAERAAGENVIRRYGAGVCLIQGSYVYHDTSGRPLRRQHDDDGDPARLRDGSPALGPEGDGEVHTVDYYGTGFLVEAGGLILTNRHLAEPWWNDEAALGMEKAGYIPRLFAIRVFFPQQREPFEATVERRSETVDLALLRVDLRGSRVPVLPLDRSPGGAVAGQPVVVLGYPAGLEAILAKADTGVVQRILESHGASSDRVTEALSLQGLIRPSTTQGHIGDITDTDVVYDAPTTQGGSGGPVFNKHGQVIAVEYAVLPRFGGNSFGVPIAYALELIAVAPKARG